ncbi:TspO/MBR family protein [Anditalea andensis]|uniref:tryptophan-rich sensory protein n=1 Tax=Anditalea andensis TaxID=1048983 RepID=UPI001969FEFC|nr:tryptophan-rich sensory protein [Anditalea andensis]
MNYYISSGESGLPTMGALSEKYDSLFTPAGYAFSIWGLIYVFLLLFIGHQWYLIIKKKSAEEISNGGWWFFLSNLANGAWVVVWSLQYILLSFIVMLILLYCLIQLVLKYKLEIYDAPFRIILFIWWPIAIYFGWIILATMTNFSIVLKYILNMNALLPEIYWTIGLIAISAAVYLYLIFSRNLRESALVGVWGLVAITLKQWAGVDEVAWAALIAALLIFIAAGYHGYKNRKSSPIYKLQDASK